MKKNQNALELIHIIIIDLIRTDKFLIKEKEKITSRKQWLVFCRHFTSLKFSTILNVPFNKNSPKNLQIFKLSFQWNFRDFIQKFICFFFVGFTLVIIFGSWKESPSIDKIRNQCYQSVGFGLALYQDKNPSWRNHLDI